MEGRKGEGKLKEENRRKNRKKRKEWKESEKKTFQEDVKSLIKYFIIRKKFHSNYATRKKYAFFKLCS